MDIFVTGQIGYETAAKLYEEHKALFQSRFPGFFLNEFEKIAKNIPAADNSLDDLCIEKNTKKPYSRKNFYFDGSRYCCEIKEGGIFAALWAACEDLDDMREELKHGGGSAGNASGMETDAGLLELKHIGCEADLEKIPVDQHVVEILELLKENPYEVSSEGSYLVIFMSEADHIPDEWKLTKIGQITDSRARVIKGRESERFLTPPARQKQDIKDRKSYR